ncbi:MAG TPA: M23 family metallopeptidase [Chloroflexota bacterium]|nr:M23 family metallopeptidase [Chloroflexota bacterium]
MSAASLSRRRFLGLSLGAVATFTPFGTLLARAAAPQPIYHLPFPGGVVWRIGQGVKGGYSHQGRAAYAWDFFMPSGSPITAARAGTAWMLKQSSDQHCRDLSCPDWNNYIVIDHGDGTSAAYLHGLKDGARVRLGQRVEQGQFLGLSDMTGQAGGPHLHFQVQNNNPTQYVAQSFLIGFQEVSDSLEGVEGVPLSRHDYRSANAVMYDFDVKDGHFYTQTNGKGGGGGRGFRVTDDGDVQMWTAFKSLGGPLELGYPVSRPFRLSDTQHVYQAFQRYVIDWDPVTKQPQLSNVMDLLHDANLDGWLSTDREIPLEADFTAADKGRGWDDVIKAHLALLDANKDLKAAYFSAPDPISRFGLPMSGVADTGDALMLRTQRTVFQLWKHDVPWAKAGQVTLANAGELARDAELFSRQVFEPEQFLPEQLSGEVRLPWEVPGFFRPSGL